MLLGALQIARSHRLRDVVAARTAGHYHSLQNVWIYEIKHEHGLEEGIAELRVLAEESSCLLGGVDDEALGGIVSREFKAM